MGASGGGSKGYYIMNEFVYNIVPLGGSLCRSCMGGGPCNMISYDGEKLGKSPLHTVC
jgi:hypothetical protein